MLKSVGVAKFHTPQHPEPKWIWFQLYHCVHPGSWCAKFGLDWFSQYGSAREQKCTSLWILLRYPSIYLSIFLLAYWSHYLANFNA